MNATPDQHDPDWPRYPETVLTFATRPPVEIDLREIPSEPALAQLGAAGLEQALAIAAALPVGPSLARASVARQDEVHGRVVDSAGAPISNVIVSLAELKVATKTAADGTFTFTGVPSGRYTIVARRVGYAAAVRDVTVSGATEVSLQLAETPFQVEPVTVTATRSPASGLTSSLPTSALSEDELRREASISLSHSLGKLPGIRSLSTGEQIGKPMIRGLFGSRVLVLENGSRLEDYSWSDEDAPSVDARLAQRVEVIRGPASVLYGSDA